MSKKDPKFDPKRANVNNPNNDAFWIAQGFSGRPQDWRQRYESMGHITSSKKRNEKRQFNCGWASLRLDSFGLLPCDGFGRLSKDDY